jgi:hypothetical protein
MSQWAAKSPREPLLRFIGALVRRRYPCTVPAMAAECGVSRCTGYRYIADIDRLGTFPLRRTPNPVAGGALVGIDWPAWFNPLRGRA